jgi:23S rRNA (cytidine2498-2'-O)-methyltransferase
MIKSSDPLDVRNPEQVLSLVCTPTHGYLGFSLAVENLSTWAGGVHRFKREKEQISRAEFKLLEILNLFQLSLSAGDTALDLGAAPGGWTRIL